MANEDRDDDEETTLYPQSDFSVPEGVNLGDPFTDEPIAPMTWRERRAFKREQRMVARVTREVLRDAKREQKRVARARRKVARSRAKQPHLALCGDFAHEAINASLRIMRGSCRDVSDDFAADVNDRAMLASHETRMAHTAMRDRRFKYVAAFGTWITVLLVTLLATCSACSFRMGRPGELRTSIRQDNAAVLIGRWCVTTTADNGTISEPANGSGVAIDNTHVLTALHVVECEEKTATPVFYIKTRDGRTLYARVVKTSPRADIALLELKEGSLGVERAQIGRTFKGDTVCVAPARPTREGSCGKVSKIITRNPSGDIRTTMRVIHGNSGAGVYNSRGRLVGIAVTLEWCTPADALLFSLGFPELADSCSGNASTITADVLP